MLALRFLIVFAAAAAAVCVAGYLLGGNRRYLTWAVRIVQVSAAVALVFLAIVLLETL